MYLIDAEHAHLRTLIGQGTLAPRRLSHSRILLKAGHREVSPGWADGTIARAIEFPPTTVGWARRARVEHGLNAALERKAPDRMHSPRLDGTAEARLITLTRIAPSDARERWTLRRLADELVCLGVVETIAQETVR